MTRRDLLKGLTKEQIKQVRECQSNEELLNLAKQEGVELTQEQLEAISGGKSFCSKMNAQQCPECYGDLEEPGPWNFYCPKCNITYDYEDIIKC